MEHKNSHLYGVLGEFVLALEDVAILNSLPLSESIHAMGFALRGGKEEVELSEQGFI